MCNLGDLVVFDAQKPVFGLSEASCGPDGREWTLRRIVLRDQKGRI